ncbi:MAG: hypothetical protein USCGTAYLOR_00907 [Chromatiales bacterium USCg_Taylor]|nr:MAG: hypothetical protein USCGTAYLOR_00907 [Chromatiales bacterium USCg_Taylor]
MTFETSQNLLTVDVEDWFHILDSSAVPPLERWEELESRVAANVERILAMLDHKGVKGTFFWLGWVAQRHKSLVRACHAAGHEIASHGHDHVLAYQVGERKFLDDIVRAKAMLEDILGQSVKGFRAPGFGITEGAEWAFDVIKRAGYNYDSSVFPATRGHGGLADAQRGPHWIETQEGRLAEIPQSVVSLANRRFSLFGGGYLRLAPLPLIRWGIRRLRRSGQPLVIYIHPREVDPAQPRLALGYKRSFKCYVNLESTLPKLETLFNIGRFMRMDEYAKAFFGEDLQAA